MKLIKELFVQECPAFSGVSSRKDADKKSKAGFIIISTVLLALFTGRSIAQQPVFTPRDLAPVRSLTDVGIADPLSLMIVDELAIRGMEQGAYPGCRILCARNGQVFYDKSFGFLAYDMKTPVTSSTVYDFASITKVAATTLAVMRLYEKGKIGLDKTLGEYLPSTAGTDKAGLRIRDLLTHHAGLKAWIPFYKSFRFDSLGLLADTLAFRRVRDARYTVPVAATLYMRADYRDTIWNAILKSPLENAGRTVYSDLDFYFLAAVVERITGKTIDRYVTEEFYNPLRLRSTGYNPLLFLKPSRIAPTEWDKSFRQQTLTGYVHDPGAALFGGVAGHAGLFGTAGDLAVIFQMLLNGGTYGGKRYFKEETVRLFTAYAGTGSRRALGFDKPEADVQDGGPAGSHSSGYAFGHQGFTGTCVWADPASGIVFVFLSNRVYPNAENTLLSKMSIRTEVQDKLYEALGIGVDTGRVSVRQAQRSASGVGSGL